MNSSEAKKIPHRVIKADTSLQVKVGTGPLNAETIKQCQDIIDNFDEDFAPEAAKFLNALKQAIANARQNDAKDSETLNALTTPVMQLKANASLFGYQLIGNLANIMLSFLESIKSIDNDVIDIIEAHQKTISLIVLKQLKGDGGATGKIMEQELQQACNRYYSKRSR